MPREDLIRAVKRHLNPLFALLLTAALPTASWAAAPLYTIELLLFEHVGSHTAEQWPESPGEPELLEVVDLEPREEAGVNFNPNFTPRAPHALTAAAAAMRKAGGYRILKHIAWRQPSYGERSTRPIRIEAGTSIPAAWVAAPAREIEDWRAAPTAATVPERLSRRQLEGSARVHVGKYLHLNLDLLLHRPREAGNYDGVTTIDQPRLETVRIRNHRRMRSKEIHYLDHPLVGALVIAHPIYPQQAEPAPAE